MRFLLLTLILIVIGQSLMAQSGGAVFEQANKSYENKKYREAAELYESILLTGEFSSELYYNLGNSYYRSNQLGKAILNYERALQLAPSDGDIQHNLKVAKHELVDNFGIVEPFFLRKWWFNAADSLSSSAWAIIGLLFLWAGIAGLILWLIGKERTQRKKGFFIGGILLLVSALPFLLAVSRKNNEVNSQAAIVLQKEITLRSAPDKESTEVVLIHEGSKVALLDNIGDWYKVRLSNGEQGWLPESGFEKI